MIKLKHFWGLFVFFILTILTVLGNSAFCSPVTTEPDAKEVVILAYQKFLALENYHMTTDTTASFTLPGHEVTVLMKSEGDAQAKPMLLKNVMTMTMNAAGIQKEQTIVQYAAEAGNQLVFYSQINNLWTKQLLPYYNPLAEYNNYFKAIKKVTLLDHGGDSDIYQVIIEGSYLEESIGRMTASLGMQKMLVPKDITKNAGDVKYNITVDKKNSNISRIDFDLSELMATIGNNLSVSTEVPEQQKMVMIAIFNNMKLVTSVTFSQLNLAEKIIIPREALTAPIQQLNAIPNV